MKKGKHTSMLDKFHRVTVGSLLTITAVGCAVLSYQVFSYFYYVRPARLEEKRKKKEVEIAQEQLEKESEFLRRQKEAENTIRY